MAYTEPNIDCAGLGHIEKFLRDPVHDLIRIDRRLFLRILDSRPMQRLRRIRQLGAASLVYPGAEHSRFTHSLGVYHLAGRILSQLQIYSKEERAIVQAAALLHDVGHGPFSHSFEVFLERAGYKGDDKSHESWTERILLHEESVVRAFEDCKEIQEGVREIFNKTSSIPHLKAIVSSQLDADRLDYMLRDSLMTGVHYGRFDLNWLLRNMRQVQIDIPPTGDESKLTYSRACAIDIRRGVSCLEDFILGNFYLYKHCTAPRLASVF